MALAREEPHAIGQGPVEGLVWAFRIHADGRPEELPVDRPIEPRRDGWLWLHVNLTDRRVQHFIEAQAELPEQAVALLLDAHAHQQMHATNTCVYGVLVDLQRGLGGATEDVGLLSFAMTERLLISGRRIPLNAVETTRRALLTGRKLPTVASLLELIVEHAVEALDDLAESLAAETDTIEQKILVPGLSDERARLRTIRQTTVRLHRQLAGLRTLFQRIEREFGEELNPALRIMAGRLSQRLDGLDHDIVAIRDRAHLLQEEVTFKVAEETNRQLQLLAVVSTLLLPASLIAGIFCMNVKGMPFSETDGGFLWAMAILVGSFAVIMWLLRRAGILRR